MGLLTFVTMVNEVDIQGGLQLIQAGMPVLDVRSPSEYSHARIPRAVSFPLFDDMERAEIGTLYKQVSREAAFVRGMEYVGPKMAGFITRAREIACGKPILVYCARGGKRSESMTWLLYQSGLEVYRLSGGYKAYRRFCLDQLSACQLRFIRIGGKTGSGKTDIIKTLGHQGQQVLDLEGLAHHRGSAFGYGQDEWQPSNEQFENDIAQRLFLFDPERIIWVEDESQHIGRLSIPKPFWQYIRNAPMIQVDKSTESRLTEILNSYGSLPLTQLKKGFMRIAKRLGPSRTKQALAALKENDLSMAAKIALEYYDKLYTMAKLDNPRPALYQLDADGLTMDDICRHLFALSTTFNESSWT